MKKSLLASSLILALAACADDAIPPPAAYTPVLGPKIALNLRVISLADRSGIQPANSPYASNHFSPTVAEAIKQWASDHLQAVGQTGDAIIIIKDASLNAQPLPMKDDIDSWFTRQQASKYLGHADVSIEANGPQGFAMADASASRVLTLPEDPTDIEKQDAYATMLNGLMKDLGPNLESAIRSHMNIFVTDMPAYGTTVLPTSNTAPQVTPLPQSMNAPIIQPPVMGASNSASIYAVAMPDASPAAASASTVATIPLSGPGTM